MIDAVFICSTFLQDVTMICDLVSWSGLIPRTFEPDRVITVPVTPRRASLSIWMSNVEKVHWGLPDPSRVDGDDETVRAAFMSVIDQIELKVDEWMGEVRAQ